MKYKFEDITPESFTKYLLSLGIKKTTIEDMEIKLITLTKCTAKQAQAVSEQLKKLGLEYHGIEDDQDWLNDWYDLEAFAKMRGWDK